jgi:hypothetical protein
MNFASELEQQLTEQLKNYYVEFQSIRFTNERINWLLDMQEELERMYDIKVDNIVERIR